MHKLAAALGLAAGDLAALLEPAGPADPEAAPAAVHIASPLLTPVPGRRAGKNRQSAGRRPASDDADEIGEVAGAGITAG